jgi:hypothetical protein
MKMHLRITNGDGSTADVTVSAVDLVAFEAEFNRSVAKFQDEFRLTDMFWLAWHSLRRSDSSIGDFNEWLGVADPDVEFADGDEVVPLGSSPQRSE